MISSEQRVLQPENPRPVCPTVSSFERTEDVFAAPPQTSALSLRAAAEEWVSIVLDRPLDEAKALVEDPDRLISEITAILESKQAHPLLNQMVNPDVRDDMPIADFTAASSSRRFGPPRSTTQAEVVSLCHVRLMSIVGRC